ncbi:hypothetical protein ABFS82_01G112300 [Erythranthe guttata]|nr:PREDICTED: RNA polymerase II transcriptional coactivator KIWI-like [Erythranthe guttata]|eukprot:XP_012857144.1 PREDICTED: RNA polymerase II transcriptional coactivator KIWI-like [Erythranthe guttata]
MLKRGKKRDASKAKSEGDERPKKITLNAGNEWEKNVICELSKKRKVLVRNWDGKAVMDIREFYLEDGKEYPTGNGLSFFMNQWKILRDHVDEIDKLMMVHGGDNDQIIEPR